MQVWDSDESLDEKVINLLENSLQPAITNVSIMCEGMTEQWPSPAPAVYNHSQQNFIIKSPYQEFVLISGSVTDDSVDEAISVSKAPDGIGLKELFMAKAIEDLQYDLRNNMDEAKKAKVIQYSLASKVLSEYTAYVGIDFESSVIRESGPMMRCAYAMPQMRMMKCCAAPMAMAAPMKMKKCARRCAEPMAMAAPKAAPMMMMDGCVEKCSMRSNNSMRNDTVKAMKPQVVQKNDTIEDIIDLQNPDGSWDSFMKVNNELVSQFNQKVAATIAAIVYIRKNAGSKLNSFKLILKKALKFLNKFDKTVNWEALLHKEESKL